jgi:glycerol-3-phosphate acyltransferase PlsY
LEANVNLLLSAFVILAAYLMGSIPVGLLLVRAATGKDIREIGSGRTGGTNVLRAAGSRIALVVVLLDVVKGLLPVLLARAVVGLPVVEALAGLCAVVGHNYSVFINFRGGAGTMTTIGGAFGLWSWSGVIVIAVGALIVKVTRQASLGSIVVALSIPVIFALRAWMVDAPWAHLVHGLGTAALTLWSLRPNIKRLLEGNERSVFFSNSA